MKTPLKLWVAGARPRTLPAAVVPVVVGTAAGYVATRHSFSAVSLTSGYRDTQHSFSPVNAILALVVALALQIGTNYVNDYADGVRGTDEVRVGPVRLVAGRLASVRQVKLAALASFGVSGIAGLILAIRVSYWFIPIGLLCGLAGWAYTGGRHPYGYLGLGEALVFVFFGLVATAGSAYVQHVPLSHGYVFPWAFALWAGVPVGLLAAALLQANNLRDVETDKETGKKTVAVRLGRVRAGYLYVVTLVATGASLCVLQHYRGWALIALAALPLAVVPARLALSDQNGRALLPMLATTARLQLAVGALLTIGLLLVRP
ncbi:MAG: 1,4-dihydroxy-2-naphthoate polyprenyltransferase [Acidimicrobiales bacterium]